MEDTDDDRELFNSRFMAADDMPKWATTALHITYKNADVDAANRSCIDRFDAPTFHFEALHSVTPNRKEGDVLQPLSREQIESSIRLAEENVSHDRVIPRSVDLAVGAPVTLTQNLAQEARLCNGTQATIFDFIQTATSTLPVVLVRVEGFLTDTSNIVPIPAQSLSWLINNKQLRVTRLGLPIRLAFAMTIHKVQGLTCSKLVFNTTAIPTSAFAYVGLSRIRHRSDIVLSSAFETNTSQLQQKSRATCQKEWMRLDSVEARRQSSINILTEDMQTLATIYNGHNQCAR